MNAMKTKVNNLNPEYLKVRVHGGGSMIMRVTSRKGSLIRGTRVNKFGDDFGGSGKMYVILAAKADVICVMDWNLKYAELESRKG